MRTVWMIDLQHQRRFVRYPAAEASNENYLEGTFALPQALCELPSSKNQ